MISYWFAFYFSNIKVVSLQFQFAADQVENSLEWIWFAVVEKLWNSVSPQHNCGLALSFQKLTYHEYAMNELAAKATDHSKKAELIKSTGYKANEETGRVS